ncbi:MAG: HAD family hydrolase [Thermoplasmatales archaeon]|nr:MAG: HAD family hydrolase [Thermoplasmatales archaeon]
MKNKAIFLDRDGVINKVVYHKEMGIIDSPFTVGQIKLLPNISKAINKFKDLGYKIIVVSNQPGVAKDHFSLEVFKRMKEKIRMDLERKKVVVDAEYYCLHHPYATVKKYKKICNCRKPKPGMILQAAKDHDIDISKSWMIGDGINDIQAGQKAGCRTVLIGRIKCDLCKIMEKEKVKPDYITPNLYKAFLIIEKEERG